MSLLVPAGRGAWVEAPQVSGAAAEINRQLREGRPSCGWPGDPRLELTWDAPRERWIVVRHCEDGVARGLAYWAPEELESIPMCLAQMRLDSPGHVSAEERIDRHNAALEAANDQKLRDVIGEMAEHALKLDHDLSQPRNVFRGMPGRRKD